jgi:acyl-coenzyme A thioesterase PaaI-like protein
MTLTADQFAALGIQGVPYVGQLGCRVELAVTTDLNTHLLAKQRPGDLLARGRILRLGRVLAVGEVTIVGLATDQAVTHATGTYAMPQR